MHCKILLEIQKGAKIFELEGAPNGHELSSTVEGGRQKPADSQAHAGAPAPGLAPPAPHRLQRLVAVANRLSRSVARL